MLSCIRTLLCKTVAPSTVGPVKPASRLYRELVAPGVTSPALATLAHDLAPSLAGPNELTVAQKYHILATLTARSVRHEAVLQKCIWDILKADLRHDAEDPLYNQQLAACTGSTFHIMTSSGFLNDHQMIALALGRCVELVSLMPLTSVVRVYRGLAEMNQTFFSISSVALYASEVDENFNFVDETSDGLAKERLPRTAGELANQPNLLDILCGELERRLMDLSCNPIPLALATPDEGVVTSLSVDMDDRAPERSAASHAQSQNEKRRELLRLLTPLASSLAAVGAASPAVFESLEALFRRTQTPTGRDGLSWEEKANVAACLVAAMRDTAAIHERVVDPMNHVDSIDFADGRRSLTTALATQLSNVRGIAQVLRHNPSLVLTARNLFEKVPELAEWSPALWDQVRTVRVAHKHVVAAKASRHPPSPRLGGKLFDKQFAVKVKPITQNLSDAEKFVPPQFKTWRSPVHSPRGGHKPSTRGPGRVVRFGTRRISKNYLKNKQKKYSR